MLQIKSKLKIARGAYKVEVRARLMLPFESRQKSRLRTQLDTGEEVGLMLPRGEILRGGDLVTASDGRVIEIVAQEEKIIEIKADSPQMLARVAYHLGNRHVPVQVGDGFLRIAEDHVLEEMVKKLGAEVAHVEAAFEPEGGAYHQREEMGHGGKIHDHHDHDHDHDHEHCDHPHHHHHHK